MSDENTVSATSQARQTAPPSAQTSRNYSMFGMLSDATYWRSVFGLLLKDDVAGAHELAMQLGIGQSASGEGILRMIEAEWDVRVRGTVLSADRSRSVEFLPEEAPHIEGIVYKLGELETEFRNRFYWHDEVPLRITLLSENVDAPWATARYGYCAQREPYYKICIPYHAVADEQRFSDVFVHEFAHVCSLSTSAGRIPNWLGEGFSVHASGEHSESSRSRLIRERNSWLDRQELELRFGPAVELDSSAKWLAYQQAGWITRYLTTLQPERKLLELFRRFGDESFWLNVKFLVPATDRTAEAVHHVYGKNVDEIFVQAREQLATL